MNAVNAGSFPRGCLGSDHGVGGFKGENIALWGGGGGLGNFTVTRHKQNPPTPPSFHQTIINDRS